jgi:hypothetical protein
MCPLCGWPKLIEKNVGGEIRNTEGSAMSIGLLLVRLQNGLYVSGHLSKLFTFFNF